MKLKKLFVALIFGACCCSPKNDGSVSIVDVGSNKMVSVSLNNLNSKTATVPLSSLVENCDLIQLESDEEALFYTGCTKVTDNYIGIRQFSRKPYMLFDRSGKFLCKVGAIGQGPGEYAYPPYDDIIDEKNGLIYLAPFRGDKILVYDTSGKFLRNIVAPERLNKAKIFLNDNVLTVVHLAFEDTKSMVLQLDVNTGEVLNELPVPAHFIVDGFEHEIYDSRNVSGTFDFLRTLSDTLYHIDLKNVTLIPVFTVKYSSSEYLWKLCLELNKDLVLTNLQSIVNRKFVSFAIAATDLKNKTSSYINIVNDYFGNLPLPPSIFNFYNGYFVHNIQPEQLMEDIENHLAGSSCTENDRQALKKLLSTLEEGTNNVVFIGKLKSEVKGKMW